MRSRKLLTKLVVVVGETAGGKSFLAMEIARKFNGEIINADSWQVYRGFDIGTAKPTTAEQKAIPHHLIDLVDPTQDFTAAIYKDLANQTISEISSRGKLPVLVGGTGLYVDGVLFDFSFLPPGRPGQRQQLQKLTSNELLALIEQQNIDMTGIDTRNKRRLIRLLETNGKRPSNSGQLRPNTLVIGLKIPRAQLRRRIEQRVEDILKSGLKHEVAGLAKTYGWNNEAMKGIGYREWQDYFNKKISNAQLRSRIVKSTLELAKRQRTWFKRNRQIKWVTNQDAALKLVQKFIKR